MSTSIFQTLQTVGNDLSNIGTVMQRIAERRPELIAAIEAGQVEVVRGILHQLCTDFPAANGVIAWLMGADPDTAIGAIAIYDPQLSAALFGCKQNFQQLQTYWLASQNRER
jgi:hypothetical protein